MSKPTTRSHYIPQTYLKHFLLDGNLEMYKKGSKFFKEGILVEDRIHTVIGEDALVNIGLQNNLYNPEIEGYSSEDFEDLFNAYGESFYNDLVDKIELLPEGSDIPQDIKDKLCLFMAAMRVRTPQFKWEIEDMESAWFKHDMTKKFELMTPDEVVAHMREISGEEITLEHAVKIKESIVGQKYDLKYPNARFTGAIVMMIDYYAGIFRQMTVNILKSSRYFITSDNPVVFFVPQEKVTFYDSPRSLTSPHSELFFPITKNIGASFNWRKIDQKVQCGNREMVDIFNYNISHNSFDYIFSPLKMNSLKVFTTEYIPYPFKIRIS